MLALAAQPTPKVTLALLGDVMVGRGVAQAHASGDWDSAFVAVSTTLAAADLALANLESPIALQNAAPSATVRTAYNLCATPAALPALARAGFDLFSLANNHANDCGDSNETPALLRSHGLTPFGPGLTPLYRQINGLKLAFLAFDDVSAPLDLPQAQRAIADAHRAGAVVIVSIHWGREFDAAPTDRQRRLAQGFAEAGAALVWGHHPHVLQRAEWLSANERQRPTLVVYSLGNALFDQVVPPDARRSAIVLAHLDAGGVQRAQAIPLWIEAPQGRLAAPDAATCQAILRRLGPAIETEDSYPFTGEQMSIPPHCLPKSRIRGRKITQKAGIMRQAGRFARQ